MTAINFPASPATNDTFTWNDRTWIYDGAAWVAATQVAGGLQWSAKGANFNAAAKNGYLVTAASVVVTLPASPSLGDEIAIVAVSSSITGCSVARNGNKIMGLAEDLTLDAVPFAVSLVYHDSTNGWRLR